MLELSILISVILQESFSHHLAQFYASTAPLLAYDVKNSSPQMIIHNLRKHLH